MVNTSTLQDKIKIGDAVRLLKTYGLSETKLRNQVGFVTRIGDELFDIEWIKDELKHQSGGYFKWRFNGILSDEEIMIELL